jgi:hypothetical protein
VTPDELTELYTTFKRTAWRLEARDDYAVPGDDEDFDAFLAGRPVPPRTVENSWWLRTVADATRAGKSFRRVRLLSHPVTDYTRFELASYPENIAAGEAVRIVERHVLTDSDEHWSHQDFWLFDDEIAVLQHYSPRGSFLGVTQAEDPRPYAEIRRRAESLSVPFEEYDLRSSARDA